MHEKVRDFLEIKKKEENKVREKILMELGLFEREYPKENEHSWEYCEYDFETDKYYKKVPVEVTDEEYEEIKKYSRGNTPSKISIQSNNAIAKILKVIGIIVYIAGFIASFFLGVDRYGDISAMVMVWWIVFFITGTFYLGFAEIIQLLEDIKNK